MVKGIERLVRERKKGDICINKMILIFLRDSSIYIIEYSGKYIIILFKLLYIVYYSGFRGGVWGLFFFILGKEKKL